MPEIWGVAYLRVQLIHEFLWYYYSDNTNKNMQLGQIKNFNGQRHLNKNMPKDNIPSYFEK